VSLADIAIRDPKAAFCIGRTLPLEGCLADNPHDPGGVTNCGVSLRWALQEIAAHPDTVRFLDLDHDGHVDRKDIVGLNADSAADIYFQFWWTPGWYTNLQPDLIAWKCFDIAVNTGPKRAAAILQKSLVDLGSPIPIDAQIGPKTVMAVAAEAAKDQGRALLRTIRTEQADFYTRLIAKQRDLKAFQKGWAARAAA
jgi:lysozyme family protein